MIFKRMCQAGYNISGKREFFAGFFSVFFDQASRFRDIHLGETVNCVFFLGHRGGCDDGAPVKAEGLSFVAFVVLHLVVIREIGIIPAIRGSP